MRRIVTAILLVMLVSLTGCTAKEEETVCAFTYNGIRMVPGEEAEPVLTALGEPKSYTEEPSFAFEGLDKTYGYDGFYLATFPEEKKEYIRSIWFADSTVSTEEGISLGSGEEQVKKVYSRNNADATRTYTLIRGGTKLTIALEEGVVRSVRYDAVLE